MASPRKILVVGDDDHTRFLLGKTLLRRFPQVILLECIQGSSAVTTATFEALDLVVVHRAEDMGGLELVRALRRVVPLVPLILIAAPEREEALLAGATRCLSVDGWMQLGALASELLAEKARPHLGPGALEAISRGAGAA